MPVYPYTTKASASFRDDDRALIAASLWIRVGFAGLLVCVGAAASFAHGRPYLWGAIAAIAAGCSIVWFSWRRANALLKLIDEPDTPARREESVDIANPRPA
ncbi:MAG TPA: hypothetical protein VMN79_17465 [Casimicrobiaceae bacterium]|nr:hypothetical protein [Casimicrobiaceae bacterium]